MSDELARALRRLDELETQAAFQERAFSRLDEVLRDVAARVEGLEGQVSQLRERIERGPEGEMTEGERIPLSG